jgi:membrane protein YqaA with SNARE-associated domain
MFHLTKHLLARITSALVAYGPWGLFLIAFIDSMGIPLPATIDALLILVAVQAPQRAYFAALMAVLGSLGGNLVLFLGVRHGSRWFRTTAPSAKPGRFSEAFRRYGLVALFIPAAVPVIPLPLKVSVVSAGYVRTPLRRFALVILSARVLRYFGEAYLGIRLGAGAQPFLARNAWTLVGISAVATVALFVLLRCNSRSLKAS